MDFAIPADLAPVLDKIERLLTEDVIPAEHEVLTRGFVAAAPVLDALRAKVKAAGLWAPQVPKDVGGMGLGLVAHGLVSEKLGRSPIGHYVFGAQAPDAGNLEILHKYGTPEQKTQWLEPLAAGDIRSCFSMTEPDSPGSNPVILTTTAVSDGDDYVINGVKWFTSGADGAAFAIVMAVTNPDAAKHGRASMIIVPQGTPGFELVRNIPIMGDAGGGWASHGEVSYTDVRVPKTNRLGPEGAGFLIAQERLGPGRIHHCMRWIGICERVFDTMCARAAFRKIDEEKTLASRQIIQAWVAEARAEIDAARLMVLHAAWKLEHQGFHAARDQVSLIKFYVSDVMMRLIDRAIQVHGALGVTSDTVLAHYYVHERGARIYDGPDEVHKMVVARRILKRYDGGGGR
ncbi:MAG: acyl-CoA dehydrogenase family protein [Kofleriaceae bacterium]|nr:acyl-CoA dehydrogenase family protein [Myxococcales bacterium]MCB9560316.1 acyl-CoA dehydrogenase family protein [Kofleriaceae bacterium]MCB9571754.1 acyl-CoA dehydrogenase family protein [Kofleriaceae bacterium]